MSAATIGYGVDVMKSTITRAGRGLFATRDFKTNEIITEYAGCTKYDKFQAAGCEVQTHMVRVSAAYNCQLGQDMYVDGDRTLVTGRRGGSFSNHSKKANAELLHVTVNYSCKHALQSLEIVRSLHISALTRG